MMSVFRNRKNVFKADYWPGFVDAMATMLLLIVFLLSVFIFSHFLSTKEITNKDDFLVKLERQVDALSEMLALERSEMKNKEAEIEFFKSSLGIAVEEKKVLQKKFDEASAQSSVRIERQKSILRSKESRIEILNQHLSSLRDQLTTLKVLVEDHEIQAKESETKIADLSERLNVALAKKVQELREYRSEFFGRLKSILGQRDDIQIIGDRFVFQSEILFPSGQDAFHPESTLSLDQIAEAVIKLEELIPGEITWTLQVDGHTDKNPVLGYGRFKSNWELSAARAIAVVRYLVNKGVNPRRLAAAGFSEFHPLGVDINDMAKNRRIELKLTSR